MLIDTFAPILFLLAVISAWIVVVLGLITLMAYIDGRRGKRTIQPLWAWSRGNKARRVKHARWENQLHAALFFQNRWGDNYTRGYAGQQEARIAKLRRKLSR